MRSYVKQKQYQDHVRDLTLSNKVNTPEGNWVDEDKSSVTKTVIRNVLEGTRGKAERRRSSHKNKDTNNE